MSVNNSLYCDPVLSYGTEAQKARFLDPVRRPDGSSGCFALTEPEAGSDASNQTTLARTRRRRTTCSTAARCSSPTGARRPPRSCSPDRPRRGAPRHQRLPGREGHAGLHGGARPRTSSASAPPTPPSCSSRGAGCPRAAGSARRGRASGSRWPRSTPGASASPPRRSASRARPTRRRWPMRASGRASACRSASTRWCSGCWPTWRRRSRRRGCSRWRAAWLQGPGAPLRAGGGHGQALRRPRPR